MDSMSESTGTLLELQYNILLVDCGAVGRKMNDYISNEVLCN
jgi:hypothetical protein